MSNEKLKLELGGGSKPRDGFVQIGFTSTEYPIDLETVGKRSISKTPLPFEDDSVEEVYSAHCLEHVANLDGVLWEICRVCHNGARVEIHVPHYLHPDAMCPSHKHTIGENSVKGWGKMDFAGKRLDLVTTKYVASLSFDEAKELHPTWTDSQIMRYVPGACHELRFIFNVRRVS